LIICHVHSENLEDQQVATQAAEQTYDRYHRDYSVAVAIRKVASNHFLRVAMFGRIPERNAFVGRVSTQEELAFLSGLA
jgi:uncharacterized protein (DUF924 family)